MGSKFYVSLEAARLLKGKGYNEAVGLYYNTLGELINVSDMFYREVADNIQMAKYDYLSAPSKAEAIDWLESKGIVVIAYYYKGEWLYLITPLLSEIEDKLIRKVFIRETYPSRLEAEEAAIIKTLELL